MPLHESISKKAFGENIAAERRAGKPAKQAETIAYSEKRKAAAKKRIKVNHYHKAAPEYIHN